MVIANGTCVSFCNQPKAHFGLPGYASGTIAVNIGYIISLFANGSKYNKKAIKHTGTKKK